MINLAKQMYAEWLLTEHRALIQRGKESGMEPRLYVDVLVVTLRSVSKACGMSLAELMDLVKTTEML